MCCIHADKSTYPHTSPCCRKTICNGDKYTDSHTHTPATHRNTRSHIHHNPHHNAHPNAASNRDTHRYPDAVHSPCT